MRDMKRTITIVEFRQAFGEVLDLVLSAKQPICITRHGEPWVLLKSPSAVKKHQLSDCAQKPALNVRQNLAEHMNSVHYQQRTLMITRRNTAIAYLCPIEKAVD